MNSRKTKRASDVSSRCRVNTLLDQSTHVQSEKIVKDYFGAHLKAQDLWEGDIFLHRILVHFFVHVRSSTYTPQGNVNHGNGIDITKPYCVYRGRSTMGNTVCLSAISKSFPIMWHVQHSHIFLTGLFHHWFYRIICESFQRDPCIPWVL